MFTNRALLVKICIIVRGLTLMENKNMLQRKRPKRRANERKTQHIYSTSLNVARSLNTTVTVSGAVNMGRGDRQRKMKSVVMYR